MSKSRITIKDLARELNISTSTVSRALADKWDVNPETRKAVLELAEKMNQYWSNFIKTGDPNGDNVPAWSTYTDDNKSTMVFDTTSGERVDYDAELQELISQ